MDEIKLDEFKTRLTKTKKEIEAELKTLEQPPEFGSEVDPDIETRESQEFQNQLAEAQNLKRHLIDINDALGKINRGGYGFCEECGEQISLDVLTAAPESKLCRNCKKLAIG